MWCWVCARALTHTCTTEARRDKNSRAWTPRLEDRSSDTCRHPFVESAPASTSKSEHSSKGKLCLLGLTPEAIPCPDDSFSEQLSYQGAPGKAFPELYLRPHKEVPAATDCPFNLLPPVSPRILLILRSLRWFILTPLFRKQLSLHSL